MAAIYALGHPESSRGGLTIAGRARTASGSLAPGTEGPMVLQLALGTGLILTTVVLSALAFWVLEAILIRTRPWIARPPHRPKLLLMLCLAVLWSFSTVVIGVWIWAIAFRLLDVFVTLEGAVYFSIVAYTTLGFGDILLPQEWRLLAGMASANGLLNFGLLTAMLVEVLRYVRVEQIAASVEEHEVNPHVPTGFFFGDRR
jgi:small-conductance mechanosensitive channel